MNTIKNSLITYDIAVFGDGAAGLEAAVVLVRTRLNIVVIDAGKQSNGVSCTVGAVIICDSTHSS